MKLLTVTVPCYNSQDYMRTCIDSLLTGGDRVEIIIINDGSHDDTGIIADSYATRFPNIVQVIHQENGGHGEGINQGLRHATGIYFKVVDSDDCVSEDFPAFLDALEACEKQGGTDVLVTNYFYVHTDGKGDRSLHYRNVFPEEKIVTWAQTRPFRVHQLLTLHSCTFRRDAMLKWTQPLPKHTFYEDNLMVYQTLPHVQRLCWLDMDLYRYTIGRAGQSVQEDITKKRYAHQLLVTLGCFQTCHLKQISDKRLRKYLSHELFMMFAISIMFARLNQTKEADQAIETLWEQCRTFDRAQADHFRFRSSLWFLCLPGRFGQKFCCFIYRLANKIVRFN